MFYAYNVYFILFTTCFYMQFSCFQPTYSLVNMFSMFEDGIYVFPNILQMIHSI